MLTITPLAFDIIETDYSINGNQIAWAAFDGIYLFDGTQTTVISDNTTRQGIAPQVDNGQVVWYTYNSETRSDFEIFFYDGTETIQLADDTVNSGSSDISNGQVVWDQSEIISDTESSPSEIFLYDGTRTIQITDNEVDDSSPMFYGEQIVWQSSDPAEGGTSELILYDNGQTEQLTDNQVDEWIRTVEGNYILWSTYTDNTSQEDLFAYDGTKSFQLTVNGLDSTFSNYFDTDGLNIVWLENEEVYLYDGNNTRQITNDGLYKDSVQISGNRIVWLSGGSRTSSDTEVFLYDGDTTTQLTNNDFYEDNLLIDGENIVWDVDTSDDISYLPNDDIYIYKDGIVSLLWATDLDDEVLAISGNTLVGVSDDPNGYYRSYDEIFIATWTDDTFPIIENIDQYGASYPDLIRGYGYDLDALKQHYIQHGRSEGRSLDLFDELEYLASNPDLIEGYGDDGEAATRHYIEHGYDEERNLDSFDANRYLASYPDLIEGYGGDSFEDVDSRGAIEHYVQYGLSEGRSTTLFDPIAYMQAYPDIATGFNNDPAQATLHYIVYGYDEGRSP